MKYAKAFHTMPEAKWQSMLSGMEIARLKFLDILCFGNAINFSVLQHDNELNLTNYCVFIRKYLFLLRVGFDVFVHVAPFNLSTVR